MNQREEEETERERELEERREAKLEAGAIGTARMRDGGGGGMMYNDDRVTHALIPTSFGPELRACLRCRLVKTYDQVPSFAGISSLSSLLGSPATHPG
jgi:hypothetical protein